MAETLAARQGRTNDTRFRLRRDVYDRLTAKMNATTVDEQVRLTGVSRTTLWRIRTGSPPNLASAMRICDALGVHVDVLFERVEEAA